jgi:hypothetical protein
MITFATPLTRVGGKIFAWRRGMEAFWRLAGRGNFPAEGGGTAGERNEGGEWPAFARGSLPPGHPASGGPLSIDPE